MHATLDSLRLQLPLTQPNSTAKNVELIVRDAPTQPLPVNQEIVKNANKPKDLELIKLIRKIALLALKPTVPLALKTQPNVRPVKPTSTLSAKSVLLVIPHVASAQPPISVPNALTELTT